MAEKKRTGSRLVDGKWIQQRVKPKEFQDCYRAGREVGTLESDLLCAQQALQANDVDSARHALWSAHMAALKVVRMVPEIKEDEARKIRRRSRVIHDNLAKSEGEKLDPGTAHNYINRVAEMRRSADTIMKITFGRCTWEDEPKKRKTKAVSQKKKKRS
jgi:metal-dependent HD superfamily phosphatase/phosphodiesterase